MEDILGTELIIAGGNSQNLTEAFQGVKFVGLYFGAHWAPCCRRFTTTLTEKYNEINANSKEFEVVFVSKDGNQEHFNRNFGEMPWKAVKYDDEARKKVARAEVRNHGNSHADRAGRQRAAGERQRHPRPAEQPELHHYRGLGEDGRGRRGRQRTSCCSAVSLLAY